MIEIVENGVKKFKGTKPHLVEKSSTTYHYPTSQGNISLPGALHRPLQYFIDKYYEYLTGKNGTGLLKNAKVIECELLLDEQDIQEFRKIENNMPGYFRPAYIEYYGQFFYVNRIANFGANVITKVELVKL